MEDCKWKPLICNSNKEFPYLIIDNWYTKKEEQMIWKEIEFYSSIGKENLLRAETTIVAKKNEKPLGKAYRVYLDTLYNFNYRNNSNIIRLMEKQRTKEFHDLITKTMVMGRVFKNTNSDNSMLSYYEHEDYYEPHVDNFQFTCLIWFHKIPKKYEGGEFYFPESRNVIESKHNRLLIFPSYYLHGVKKIKFKNKNNKFGQGRYTITHFYYTVVK
jgi:Rps23 Pro-64 3,4-dihydroxylase Tpa1-like proline 4-hydroxylase